MIKLFEVTNVEAQLEDQEKIELPLIRSPQEFFIEGKVENQI